MIEVPLRYSSIICHFILITLFCICLGRLEYKLYIIIVLQVLILKCDSGCYQNHCQSGIEDECSICGMKNWVRMRHCYTCQRCIHKYDHHCVLLGVCIGEFNHKYYLSFLVSHYANLIFYIHSLNSWLYDQLVIDEFGIEHISASYIVLAIFLIFVYLNFLLLTYLLPLHFYFAFTNQNTYQFYKRDTIVYLKNVSKQKRFPFSKGIIDNLKVFLLADKSKPNQWCLQSDIYTERC